MFGGKQSDVPFLRDMKSTAASAVMVMDGIRALPSKPACNSVYTALADKDDLSAEDLEELANKLGRLAWELRRERA
jgi:hypothetical protein